MTDAVSSAAGRTPLSPGLHAPAGAEHLAELIRQTIDPLALMQRVADQLVAMIDAADGALVGLLIDSKTIRYLCGSGYLSGFAGERLALEGSLSGNAIRTRRTLITDDTEADGRVNRDATRSFNVRSSVCVPLGRGDVPVGVLNISSARPGAFCQEDVSLLGGLAEFVSTAIGAATDLMTITARMCGLRRSETDSIAGLQAAGVPGGRETPGLRDQFVANVLDPAGAERIAARERIERAMDERQFEIAYQPVFDLRDGSMFALEALARFAPDPYRPPDVWLAEAHQAGLGVELELALLRAAVERVGELPEGALLTLNAGPEAICSRGIADVLAGVDPRRLVIELTEHVAVEDYPALAEALSGLRAAGVRLAIDDAGAGFASLMHILRLAPELIKLDRELISGIDLDPVRRSLVGSLLRFAEETGARIVAEGVEAATELAVLDELGIHHAQGFYLARPAPLQDLAAIAHGGAARVRRQTRGLSMGGERIPRAASLSA
ncbi:MAG TPA: EAL domain-containing protein [Solirubrobacteraceae bacterium]|jgi:EAL domain-containing protein (putative c-di-GMP-specific phosphodiesterase class I)/putative methionine-R-sulfoxide reductase with GAF domain|nr:EAL domain-containing protein [Solirubrobacteraceae bacterium]